MYDFLVIYSDDGALCFESFLTYDDACQFAARHHGVVEDEAGNTLRSYEDF